MAEIVVNLLLEKLSRYIEEKATLLGGLHDEVREMKDELQSIRAFLRDADRKTTTDEGIETWVMQVREVANDIEDLLDGYMYHLEGKGKGIRGWLPNKIWDKNQLATELQKIKSRVHNISERRRRYELHNEENSSYDAGQSLSRRVEVADLIEDDRLVGVDKRQQELVRELIDDEPRRMVISVVGMPGLGKTTLAAKACKTPEMKQHFKHIVCITVSQSFKLEDILRDIIRQLPDAKEKAVEDTGHSVEDMKSVQLLKAINSYLESVRYLVILDDVWKLNLWNDLRIALPNSRNGSRILITTRYESVANGFGNEGRVYPLPDLDGDDPLKLFVKEIFGKKPCPQALLPLAQKIVKKCGGIPLAIVALAGLLSSKGRTLLEWENVYKSLTWEFSNNEKLLILKRVLSLSYDDLPCHLKPCFLYCCIFPEDHLIKRKRLIRLWVANDFIKERPNMTKEEVADEYLKELIQRSMLQAIETNDLGRVRTCRIHDMMRELALSISEELNFCKVYDKEEASLHCNARHLAIHKCGEYIGSSKGMTKIHSLIVFDRNMPSLSILDVLSPILMFLKVLDLEGLNITSLPDSLCDLYFVRYLSLRCTKVKDLPKSIGRLQNLETLDVRHTEVTKLPKSARELRKLRNLFIYNAYDHVYYSFEHFSGGVVEEIHSFSNLQCLVDIQANDKIVEQIGCLTQLRRFEISKVKTVHGNDLCRSIQKMTKLIHLSIWAIHEDEPLELEALSDPPPHLQQIHLGGLLKKLPQWFSFLPSLTHLWLRWSKFTEEENPLAPLQHLASLVFLEFVDVHRCERLCFQAGCFNKLKILTLVDFIQLNCIEIEEGAMPCIQQLALIRCMALRSLNIHSLTWKPTVVIDDVERDFIQKMIELGLRVRRCVHPSLYFLRRAPTRSDQQKIVMKVSMHCQKCRSKAMKIAAAADGVHSVAVQSDQGKVVVVGDGVDAFKLVKSLRKKSRILIGRERRPVRED